ncbi:MAG: hypothetical protein A2821_00265 [Candidatus Magasanikbacteria bacterium RIFCSPHIGHO2_01_FULL_41_23]|uniref:Transcobalamin-like C-terminal domain-containing protein n=1 Tax=Candidatus Magasanikbacteria bacterium RIFCSPLOWO2_01_FULL_40_15 TaxID=1798686 RepID=A0A1F6N3U9_9BACT|nr:MAG: hypothetical protein A2821_00265 [Candidatus Magasanikbacteria bacterium RIFCSPHIGHO2_01_FULL_41_23]OGH76573.1 MAG: hypothetical protein A3F22_04505 [Candidatus Magasanikbacteria bacterium RIFCSPHIGHO2_12_FULL_41_16]OGH78551.1 MAG: hypothetical protein A2983_02705 [Candidatus Magasanikbacteria bacterium RIFCSPLOWO2_01_FULL_40_15]
MKIKNNAFGYLISLLVLTVLFFPVLTRAEEENSTTTTTTATLTEQTTTTTPTITETPTALETTTITEISSSTPVTVLDFAQLTIRIDNTIIFSDSIAISPATTTVTDNQNKNYDVVDNTVLGMIFNADSATTTFAVTDLAYYSSFDSFLINCIAVADTSSCYNWQYTVNDVYPYMGIDDYILKNNDDVYLYFGNQTRFNLATSTITTAEPLAITTEKYDYRNNQWTPRPNVTVGATKPDPNNPWSPIVVTSTLTNEFGLANLYISVTGTYNVGISEDYYYPTQAVTVLDIILNNETTTTTVTSTPTTTTSTIEVINSNNSGGSGSTTAEIIPTMDVVKAIEFLKAQQNKTTGAIGFPNGVEGLTTSGSGTLYSDWAAIAFGSDDNLGEAKNLLATYLKTDPSPGTAATDFERRAMAIMSLGINPYSGTKTNYIAEILKTYQANQFGDSGLVNDDIFALFPLIKAGYTISDTEIKNSVAFILSRQNQNGGWESPDLTAAAVQALSLVKSQIGVNDALIKAKEYLKTSTKNNGSIGDNVFSTSWGIQAIVSLNESINSWNGTNENPLTYLAKQQQTDGGFESASGSLDNRIWATSYAIPAAQNKVWADILVSFAKPVIQNTVETNQTSFGSGGSGELVTSTPTITPAIINQATSTPNNSESEKLSSRPIETAVNESPENNNVKEVVIEKMTEIAKIESKFSNSPSVELAQNQLTVLNESESPIDRNNNVGEIITTVIPLKNTSPIAGREFAGAATMASSAGAYLAWRFFQSLI